MTTQAVTTEQTLPAIFYEDPEPIEDGMQQEPTIHLLISMLRYWFRGRNVFIAAGGFIFWNRSNGNDRIGPDGFIALDTDPDFVYRFPNYWIWEVGKPPDLVMEVASPSTASNDLGYKRDLYASLGIAEYWRFDPTGGDLYGVALMGERLVDGEYVPYELLVASDGSAFSRSEALALNFHWDGYGFDIRDPLTGQTTNPVDLLAESSERAERESERAERAERERNLESERAERERQARLELEDRLRRIEAERRRDDDREQPSS